MAGLVALVVAITLGPVVPAQADAAVSLSVGSIGRDSPGHLTYDLTTSANASVNASGGLCYSFLSCVMTIEAQTAAGTTSIVSISNFDQDADLTVNRTGGVTSGLSLTNQITAVRARLTESSNSITGDWIPVTDPGPTTAAIALDVSSIGRDATGYLTYDLTATATTAINRSDQLCYSFLSCVMTIEAQTAAGTTSIVSISNFDQDADLTVNRTGGVTSGLSLTNQITAVRARLTESSNSITGDWIPVTDPGPTPATLWFTIEQLTRNSANQLTLDLTAAASPAIEHPGQLCGVYPCAIHVDALASDGSTMSSIRSVTDFEDIPTLSSHFVATLTSGPTLTHSVVGLRLRLTSSEAGSTPLTTDWIPVAENVHGGHDLSAAAELALAAVGAMQPLEACLTLFPTGTHSGGSSVPDQQLACLSGTQGGQTVRSFLTSYIGSLSPRQVTTMLVAAGLAQSELTSGINVDLDYGRSLPAGCTWTSLTAITCSNGVYRPISAPPAQDPVWESNAGARVESSRNAGQQVPPTIISAPLEGPLANASPSDINVLVQLACEDYLVRWGDEAGVDEDSCETMPVFVTGGDVREASEHDLAAITVNPAWFALQMVKTGATSGEKTSGRPTWPDPPCPSPRPEGMQCDEYPFFATEQGYFPGMPLAAIDLALIDATHNAVQGNRLGVFTRTCPKLDQSARWSEDRWYLVVPVPWVDTAGNPVVMTHGICN